jgi:hypothetical protein
MLSHLDASTGIMIVAALAGGAAGVGVLLRMYSNRFILARVDRIKRTIAPRRPSHPRRDLTQNVSLSGVARST